MKKTEALLDFLKTASNQHLTKLYTPDMEVQVNVAQDQGKRTGGEYLGKRWVGWTDGNTTWKSFRVPWNAKNNPEYIDKELYFSLEEHVEGIGLTGWNWASKASEWVGFDFDSIANHKQGLTNDELEHIKQMLYDLDYVTLVKSTSGNGIHAYIHLAQRVPTLNHTEHAALARSILSVLSMDCGFNFNNSVDTCGMVLWIYHRKQENTDGLSLLKEGQPFPNERIPNNWREHIAVTTGRTQKVKTIVHEHNLFDQLVSSTKYHKLDEEHRRVLNWLIDNASDDRDAWWDNDHNMLICHTYDLKRAHVKLNLRGIFYTESSGSSRQNCFAFPAEAGSWIIRRHSQGVNEHPSWITDPSGWTRCLYNAVADLQTCARSNGGVENSKGEFVFNQVEHGIKALHDAGVRSLTLDTWERYDDVKKREMFLKEKGDAKIIIAFKRDAHDDLKPPQFIANNKGDRWECVIHSHKKKKEVDAPDFLVRHVISNEAEAGWWIYTRNKWIQQNRSNVVTVLLAQNNVSNRTDTEIMMSKAILNPWELVNVPFDQEYPGDRKWNRNAASFSCKPEEGPCKTWLEILEHCGNSLDVAVENNEWCVENAISNGKEYLLCWVASMFQRPTEPLPYLFFVGPQNCGKSTLHEALSKLMTFGYARADNALINQQGFNAEIFNAVLCVVEETNLNKNKDASNRIKDWVTGRTISINTKHKTVYDIINTTHWIQCANEVNFCPIFPGDTRIVICRVNLPKQEVPKYELFQKLEKEKSAFLHLIMDIELPSAPGRLAIPCITTAEKAELENYNTSALIRYMREATKSCRGHSIEFDNFYHHFIAWLPADERNYWTKMRVSRQYPKDAPYVKGKMGQDNITYLGNITMDLKAKDYPQEFYIDPNMRLQRRMYND